MTQSFSADVGEGEELAESAPIHVLIVEDDQAQSRAMVRWFETTGDFDVTLAETGTEAHRYLMSSTRWDIVVSDIDLPGMDGLELLAFCKQHQPEAPVLMVTAHRNFDYVVAAIRSQADDFMLKPLDKAALVARAEALVASARSKPIVTRSRVLAIGARPDVVEMGCCGALLAHVARGDEVTILTLTGAAAWGPGLVLKRQSEVAARAIGAQLRVAYLPDGNIPEGGETVSVIRAALRRLDPNVVYTHSVNDRDRANRAAFEATVVACHDVPNVYSYQPQTATVDFRPSVFINIGPHLDRKLEVLSSYRTDNDLRPYLEPEFVRSTAYYWGRFSNYQAAEPLELIRRSELT